MNQQETDQIINKTVAFVKEKLQGIESGHNWFHTERVWRTARHICDKEQGDLVVVELAALLHDIGDAKFHGGDEDIGSVIAGDFLAKNRVDQHIINHVQNIIKNVSFAGGNYAQDFSSLELHIVQDADRLDAIGAIGIARAFNYGGYKGRELYDPAIPPRMGMTKEEYRNHIAPTINHFYEKLLFLKDRMNTSTAKAMAAERHQFMEEFLYRFLNEWQGKM